MSKIKSCAWGPGLAITGILVLWENESRFNYYEAARDATQISSPHESSGEPISFTSRLDTDIPITGDYIERFISYHKVSRRAAIYSWHKGKDSEGHTTWELGWHSRLEKNSRNSGLQQKLSSRDLYPSHYILGDMRITKDHIHFVDSPVAISVKSLELTNKAHSLKPRNSGGLYLTNGKPNNLGDERVIYKGIPNAPMATYFGVISDEEGVGKQLETVPEKVSSLIKNDGILHHLVNGGREAALIKMKENFERIVWYTRIGGSLAIIVGIYFFFNSFYSLLYRIPLVERLVNKGAFVGSLAIGTPIALIVIISGLMTHNPFSVAFPLIIIITLVTYFILRSKTTKKQANHMLKERLSKLPPPLPQPQAASDSAITTRFKTIPPPLPPPLPPPQTASTSEILPRFKNTQKLTETITDETSSSAISLPAQDNNLIEQTFLQLATMGHAEGGFKKKERKLLNKWGGKHNVSEERMSELLTQAKKGGDQPSPTKREDLELLTIMALVDGEISTDEWKLLVKFAQRMGLALLDVRNIIRGIESGELVTS